MLSSLGLVGQTIGTIDQNKTASIPTPIDTLVNQKDITSDVFSVFITPTNTAPDGSKNGEVTIGGYDSANLNGSLTYA
jgi:hypothetical protein